MRDEAKNAGTEVDHEESEAIRDHPDQDANGKATENSEQAGLATTGVDSDSRGKRTIRRTVRRDSSNEVIDEEIEEDIIWAPQASSYPYPVG